MITRDARSLDGGVPPLFSARADHARVIVATFRRYFPLARTTHTGGLPPKGYGG